MNETWAQAHPAEFVMIVVSVLYVALVVMANVGVRRNHGVDRTITKFPPPVDPPSPKLPKAVAKFTDRH